jgi:hypothetical protein
MHNSASSLNMLYTAENSQFYSGFCQKRLLKLSVFAKNAQFCSAFLLFEDNAKLHFAFSVTALSYATASDQNCRISGRIRKIFVKMLVKLCWVSFSY